MTTWRGEKKKGGRGRRLLWLIGGVALVWLGLSFGRVGGDPEVSLRPSAPAIGHRTSLQVDAVSHGRGLAAIAVELEQAGSVLPVAERSFETPPAWRFWDRGAGEVTALEFQIGADAVEGLKPGEATVRVIARNVGTGLLAGHVVAREQSLPVQLRPPSLQVLSTQHYVRQGGAEVVVYRVGATAVRDGVQVGDRWFPGFPLPGGAELERFALFSAPWDEPTADGIRVVAEDVVENRVELPFVDRFTPRPPDEDTIRLDEAFLQRVVPPILAAEPDLPAGDDLLASYLAINGELRGENARTLERLGSESRAEFLWDDAFLSLPNAQVMSSFADRRTYVFQGRTVDHQGHLGYDLASIRRAEVPAANDGVVALAGVFGIYGNAVVVDHGFGLQSLYGHLSTIDVKVGQPVTRGETVGRTGATGLAGGDHLHFTMMLHGLAVDPIEWWDAHWIRDRLGRKLGSALPFSEEGS